MKRDRSLRLRSDIIRVRRARFATSDSVVVYHDAAVDVDRARYAISVPRIVGKAVVRNRVRRRLREALGVLDANVIEADIVIVAKADASTKDFDALRQDLEEAFGAAGLLRQGE